MTLKPDSFEGRTIAITGGTSGIGGATALAFAQLGARVFSLGLNAGGPEAPVHENVKQAMVEADERQTTLIFRSLRNTARVFRNSIASEVVSIEARPGDTDFADLQPLVAGARGREQVLEAGDVEGGIWTAGQVIGLIDDIPTCADLLQRMVSEARDVIRSRADSLAP